MASIQTVYVVLIFCFLALCQGFAPNEIKSRGASSRAVNTAPTVLYMGLFDKKPAKKATKKGDASFLDGRGARITIREDEDAAMWVEEPKAKPAPKNKGKK